MYVSTKIVLATARDQKVFFFNFQYQRNMSDSDASFTQCKKKQLFGDY